ncbi:3-phosphoshikimate 1-carboxyvinyltransferase [Lysobacter humi (ex Lee et al. 2017)]
MSTWTASAGSPLRGRIRVPGDKSISHRAVMLASIADGTSRITGFLEGEDTRATARVFSRLGVRIESPAASERIVHGVGMDGLRAPDRPLDCGNAGTGMRLLAGLLSAQGFPSVLVGDESLSRRPMRRVTEPLSRLGACIETEDGGLPPLRIAPVPALRGARIETEVASAQVKSALLLAGLYAAGRTTVVEPTPTRDYTERMLRAFGYDIEFSPGTASLGGGGRLHATDVDVPADFSSAAFFLVAASIVPGSDLVVEAVGMNPRRTGLLDALRLMGADIDAIAPREQGGEPVADLRVRYAPLRGIEVPTHLVPDMIDEFPALFAAAACADGETRVRDAAELRVKESDRIATMAAGLRALGADVEEFADGARIRGGALHAGAAGSHGDHRIAMALAVAAQRVERGGVRIDDTANVATSFPGFVDLARGAGFGIDEAR